MNSPEAGRSLAAPTTAPSSLTSPTVVPHRSYRSTSCPSSVSGTHFSDSANTLCRSRYDWPSCSPCRVFTTNPLSLNSTSFTSRISCLLSSGTSHLHHFLGNWFFIFHVFRHLAVPPGDGSGGGRVTSKCSFKASAAARENPIEVLRGMIWKG